MTEQSYEAASQASDATGHIRRRAALVQKAVSDWKGALVDLGGRNNLLHYRDLARGTLDLTIADSETVSDLLIGKTVSVSFTPDQAGKIQFFCKYHKSRGMVGTLDVSA